MNLTSRPSVYLIGSITRDPVCVEWRREAARLLQPAGIVILDPCRGKDPREWSPDGMDAKDCIYGDGAFVPRDLLDLRRAWACLFHWPKDPGRQSLGSWMEFGSVAMPYDGPRKPVVFSDPEGHLSRHPFVYRHAAKVTRSLEQACEYVRWLLIEQGACPEDAPAGEGP